MHEVRPLPDERIRLFSALLTELASSNNIEANCEEQYCQRFIEIYQTEGEGYFRHQYSYISSIMLQIHKNRTGDNQYLMGNINVLCDYARQHNRKEIGGLLYKLFDHISLEKTRLDHLDGWLETKTEKINQTLDELERETEEIKKPLNDLQEKQDELDTRLLETQNKLEGMQREYTAILGIFAAIVITFTASSFYSSSVLSNIQGSSAPRLIVIFLLIGIVLVNLVFGLFHCMERIIHPKRLQENKKSPFPIPWIVVNVLMVMLMIATIVFRDYLRFI